MNIVIINSKLLSTQISEEEDSMIIAPTSFSSADDRSADFDCAGIGFAARITSHFAATVCSLVIFAPEEP